MARTTDLYQLLYETFTINELSEAQLKLLELPWLRIYTTNYDDSVEKAFFDLKRSFKSFNYDEKKPRKILPGSVVHLHGTIGKTNRGNVLEQLILNEGSYIKQHFENSIWYDEFIRDIRFATNCFFIGYSLSDYHISALLHPVTDIKDKTYFVNRSTDKIFERRVQNYGQVIPEGLEDFSKRCISLPRLDRLKDPFSLKSFRYFDPHKDKKTLAPPTAIEILNLVTYGTFNEKRCIASLPGRTYVVPRQERVENAAAILKTARSLLVHSRLGNGKSLFLSLLAYKLSEIGYKCFWCQDISPTLNQDINALHSLNNVVIIFDSYDVALDVIRATADRLDAAKFVIAIRTGIQDVRLHEIRERLPSPLERINLNGLLEAEKDDFFHLLDDAGILEPALRKELSRCEDIREVVTSVYKHSGIKEKLQQELEPILGDSTLRTAMVSIHLLNIAGQYPDSAFLRAITGGDTYVLASKFREAASEIVHFNGDDLRPHSPIFSEYLSENFFDAEDVVSSIYSIVTEGVRRKPRRPYQAITSYFMQVTNLKRLVKGSNQSSLLAGLFDQLHRDINVNGEPLFWLQYSILMMDMKELGAAERFLNTAYARASSLTGFKTFQLDTHALRILLMLESADTESKSVVRFEQILTQLDNIASMLNEASHRPYALRALKELENFVRVRGYALTVTECNALLMHLNRLTATLQSVQFDDDSYAESQETSTILESVKEIILMRSA
ncbi:hypothetical protein HALO32_02490 [Halomonas lysinitropha]|uniref:Uncharacterized protein n=1 Tax=Halomonas lysinitropha TaxID=2607506 RepID=A0A5K1I448_9GAMM|nr:hypothetical protein HALO32_02490 [Halomonas lysinitropha]